MTIDVERRIVYRSTDEKGWRREARIDRSNVRYELYSPNGSRVEGGWLLDWPDDDQPGPTLAECEAAALNFVGGKDHRLYNTPDGKLGEDEALCERWAKLRSLNHSTMRAMVERIEAGDEAGRARAMAEGFSQLRDLISTPL